MLPFILTFAEGILTFISPCILPMLPLYFMYLAGTPDTTDSQNAQGSPAAAAASVKSSARRPSSLIINSLGFVSGFTLVFIILGAVAATIGGFFESNRDLLQKISGAVMVLFGLNFTGIIKVGFLNSERRFHINIDNLRFMGSVLFGAVFGLGWSPCLGAFLGSALVLAGNSGTVAEALCDLFDVSPPFRDWASQICASIVCG